jgi:DNA repair protein RecN (Recombination protein N)
MLRSLSIQNYALINDLQITFENGFTIITGETGAGKSILLGALSLLVGQRADATVLLDNSKKCVVEGSFIIGEYNLQNFFVQNELDYDNTLIIRREVLDNGRSRAFVNDSPVNLSILKELGDRLIDIHSQYQNSFLAENSFQLRVIDILSKSSAILEKYKISFKKYSELNRILDQLKNSATKEQSNLDYFQFQYTELEKAKLKPGEQIQLEEELKLLSHAEEIKSSLTNIHQALSFESSGALNAVKESIGIAGKIKTNYSKAGELQDRLNSIYVELKDISSESLNLAEKVELDPLKLEEVKARLDLLYALCHKHRAADLDELITQRDTFAAKIEAINGYEDQIIQIEKELTAEKETLNYLAVQLSENRISAIKPFEDQIVMILQLLGMPNGSFAVKMEKLSDFNQNGLDIVGFLFSANKQVSLQEISKVASGGEISRLMLAIKSVIANALAMPAVIFDEIDAGVSGDIADRMGNIMKQMSQNMQVISITHLPQVASKGKNHFLVYKTEGDKYTNTQMKLLNGEDRVVEIAKMLSGEQISDAAITNARVLLNN